MIKIDTSEGGMRGGEKLFKLKGDIGTSTNCGLVMDKFRLEGEEMFHMSFQSQKYGKETEQNLKWSLIGMRKVLSDSERLDMV